MPSIFGPSVVQNFRRPAILAKSAERGGQGERAADDGRPWRRLSRAARIGTQDLRALSRRILAQIGGGAGLSDRIYRRTEPERISRLVDPRGIWRLGTAAAGRSRDPRGDQRFGLHREPRSRPDVHHGHPVAARQRGAEAALSAKDRVGRIAPAGIRGDRADHRLGHDKLKTRAVKQGNHYVINGQKVWTSRARHSDLMLLLARTTPVDE